jgi:putative chitobiose transport system substrate-binding protein
VVRPRSQEWLDLQHRGNWHIAVSKRVELNFEFSFALLLATWQNITMNLKRLLAASLVAVGLVVGTASDATENIEFWTMSLKPKFVPYFEKLVKKYEAQNPGVSIEWIDFPGDLIQTKLVTRIVAGTPPALVNLNVPWADEYARDGLIVPVDKLMGNAKSSYVKAAIDDLTFAGKTYGFPLYSNVAIIAYNTKLFKDAGLTRPPKSLDEQLAFSRQIFAKTGKAGFAPGLAKADGFMLQQGLPIIENGKAVFNSPGHVALIEKLAATYKAGGILKDNLFSEDNFPAVIAAYNGGRLAMLTAPPTAVKRIETDAKDIYAVTDITPAPLGPTGIVDGGWLIHFAVPTGVDPKLLPAIGKFAQYITNDENQLEFAKLANVFPTTVKAANDPYFQKLPEHAGASEKAVAIGAESMKQSRTLYVAGIDDYDELRRSLVNAVEAGITGKQDVKAALDAAVAIWNKKLAKQQKH